MDLKQTKAAVEAMLFAHAEPVTAERLAGVLGVEEDAVSRLLLSLRDDYEAEDRGLVLLQLEDRWQLASLAELPPLHGDDYAEMEEAAGEAAYSGDEDADGAQAFAPEGDV